MAGSSLKSDRIKFADQSAEPSSPAVGDTYFDTDDAALKVYDGTNWVVLSGGFNATGGTESTYTTGGITYKVHSFTSSGTFTVTAGQGTVEYVVVAGGGGGGGHADEQFYNDGGGGGGAGGYRSSV
jgi:hypothetical protein